MNLRSTVIIYADLLQHADTLQNFVHESSSLVTGFHQIMAWERSFEKRIDGIRQTELHWQARNYMIEVGFN
jgi:hypothetical protein